MSGACCSSKSSTNSHHCVTFLMFRSLAGYLAEPMMAAPAASAPPGYGYAAAPPGYGAAPPGYGSGYAPGQMVMTGMPVAVVPAAVVPGGAIMTSGAPGAHYENSLDVLARSRGLYIKEKIRLLEVLTDFQQENTFKGFLWEPTAGPVDQPKMGKGAEVFTLKEVSSCCQRQFCGRLRAFDVAMVPSTPLTRTFHPGLENRDTMFAHPDALIMNRPFRCTMCCFNRPKLCVAVLVAVTICFSLPCEPFLLRPHRLRPHALSDPLMHLLPSPAAAASCVTTRWAASPRWSTPALSAPTSLTSTGPPAQTRASSTAWGRPRRTWLPAQGRSGALLTVSSLSEVGRCSRVQCCVSALPIDNINAWPAKDCAPCALACLALPHAPLPSPFHCCIVIVTVLPVMPVPLPVRLMPAGTR